MPIVSDFRSALRLIGLALVVSISPVPLARATSPAADGYDPNITFDIGSTTPQLDGNVYCMATEADGSILIGGSFTELQPRHTGDKIISARLARILPDGSVDRVFAQNVNIDDEVDAIAIQADGKIVIGGKFKAVDKTDHPYLARLNADGTIDANNYDHHPANKLIPTQVTAIAIQADQKILVGGSFTSFDKKISDTETDSIPRQHIARFNPDFTLDTTFDPGADGFVLAIALQKYHDPAESDPNKYTQKILVGGNFQHLGKGADNIPMWVYRIGRLYLDGTVDQGFTAVAGDGSVASIAVQSATDDSVLIGGSFTVINNDANHAHLARLTKDGLLDSSFGGGTDGDVGAIQVMTDGRIVVAGGFGTAGNVSSPYVARLLPNGVGDSSFVPVPNSLVFAIAVQKDGAVVMGGAFTTLATAGVTSINRGHIARVTKVGGLDTDFRPDLNGRLRKVALQSDGQILVGGSFTSIGGATHSGLVRLKKDGSVDSTFQTRVNGVVTAIFQEKDGKILIGGSFSSVNGIPCTNLARLESNGQMDTGFKPSIGGQVFAIVEQSDGQIIVGGNFTSVTSNADTTTTIRNYIARLSIDGVVDAKYDPNMNGVVDAIVMQPDGTIYAGGAFTSSTPNGTFNAIPHYGIIHIKTDGTPDSTFSPHVLGSVYALGVQSDGAVVIGGAFKQLALATDTTATDRAYIARITADGKIDANFNPTANAPVDAIAVQSSGKISIGGYFSSLTPNGGTTVFKNYLAQLNSDGTVDTGFDAALDVLPGNLVISILPVGSNGQVLVGGAFTTITHGAVATDRNRLAQLNSDGSVDTSFNTDLGSAVGGTINALATQLNGSTIVAGDFAGFGGANSSNLAQFYSDGSPSTTFTPSITNSSGPSSVYSIAQLVNKGQAIATQRAGFAWLNATGGLRDGFSVSDQIAITAVNDIFIDSQGRVVLAGTVAAGDPSTRAGVGVILMDAQGNPVPANYSYTTAPSVYAVAEQKDGKLLVGGQFTVTPTSTDSTTTSVTYNNLMRLNTDGTIDTTFTPSVNYTIYAIALDKDQNILIGGQFTSITPVGDTSGTNRAYIARLNKDGTLDKNFNPTANSTVEAIVVESSGQILVGGTFTTFTPNGTTTAITRDYLALLNSDGTVDTKDFKIDGGVYTLATQADGKILIGGYFSSIDGNIRYNCARIDPSTDHSVDDFNPDTNGPVNSIAVDPTNDMVVIAGSFTALLPGKGYYGAYDPTVATPRRYIARLTSTGDLDASFNPNFDQPVTKVAVYSDGTVLAAGSFTSIQPSGSLLIGGSFDKINSVGVNNLALFSTDGSISSTFQPNPTFQPDPNNPKTTGDNPVTAGAVRAILPLPDDRLVIAGHFTNVTGAIRRYIARYNADQTLDQTFDPEADGDVVAVVNQSDGKLLVGGNFTSIGGGTSNYLARLKTDGTLDSSFSSAISQPVSAIIQQADSKILVLTASASGGGNVLMRLNANGATDTSFPTIDPGAGGTIDAVALQADGRIVVGGRFTTLAGAIRTNFARLMPNGTPDPTLTVAPDGEVTSLTIDPTGKIVLGGTFSTVDGLPRYGLARLAATEIGAESFEMNSDQTVVTWHRSATAPEVISVSTEFSVNGANYASQGKATRIAGTSDWQITGLNLSGAGNVYVRVRGVIQSSPGTSTGLISSVGNVYLPGEPIITGSTSAAATVGQSFTYAVTASNGPTLYSAAITNSTDLFSNIGLSFDVNTGVLSGNPTKSGTYTIDLQAINATGSSPVVTLTLVIAPSTGTVQPDTNPRIANLSVLANVSPSNPVIAGFVLGGPGPQTILLRAVGHSLGSLLSHPLVTPRLRLTTLSGRILRDANMWNVNDTNLVSVSSAVGATPLADPVTDTTSNDYGYDSSFLVTLDPGPYTILVSDANGGSGTILAEIYDATVDPPAGAPRLVNISARGIIDPANYLVGGFVIGGGSSHKEKLLIRGVGQTLAQQGVTNTIGDPNLTLLKLDGTALAINDDWVTPEELVTPNPLFPPADKDTIENTAAAVGAFSYGSNQRDSAVLVEVGRGGYSAQVKAPSGLSGAAMVEIYEVP